MMEKTEFKQKLLERMFYLCENMGRSGKGHKLFQPDLGDKFIIKEIVELWADDLYSQNYSQEIPTDYRVIAGRMMTWIYYPQFEEFDRQEWN